jgi:hypothetical protein
MRIIDYRIKLISDNPRSEKLKNNIIYVVGTKNYIKWAYIKCPCGCKEPIMLSLNKNEFPSWRIKQDCIGRASISPSIHRTEGCKSHFWIKRGKVRWA